jgi:SWIM zinc finger
MPRVEFALEKVSVRGSKGNTYIVIISLDTPIACTCLDYQYRGAQSGRMCKHMKDRAGAVAWGKTRCAECGTWFKPGQLASFQVQEDRRCEQCDRS